MLAVLFFISLLFYIVTSINSASKTNINAFAYTIKVQNAYEELDKIFERAEVNIGVLSDSISSTYDANRQQDKTYNLQYVKGIDGLFKSVLSNSPGADGCWFQLNADLPFSVQAYNWYQFRNDQFINLRDYFQNSSSMNRKITPDEDPYYFDALNNPIPTWSDIYQDADTKKSMITISAPIYKDTTLVGVTGIDISIDKLQQTMANMQLILENSDLYLVNKNNKVILSQVYNKNITANNSFPFLDLFKINQSTPVEYYINLTKKDAIELTLSNNYKLVIAVDNKILFGNMNRIFNIIYVLFTLLLFIAIAFFIMQYKNSQIVSPIDDNELIANIHKLMDNE